MGALKIRLHRPFPSLDVYEALTGVKAATILDRSVTFGSPGTIMQNDISTALYGKENVPSLHGYINGLGGRVLTLPEIEEANEMSKNYNDIGMTSTIDWIGYRK